MNLATLALGVVLAAQPAAKRAAKPNETGTVRAAFERYREGLLAKDGAAAAAVVDRETIAYYGRMRDLAMDADEGTVRKQPIIDKIMILRLRHSLGREAVEKLDGTRLLAVGVENGWIDASSVKNAKVGKIELDGDAATGDLEVEGRTAPPQYAWRFKREDGKWRLSLMPLLRIAEPAIQQAVKQSGLGEDAFVLALLEKVSGEAVPESVWQPLRAAGEANAPAGVAR